MFRNVDIWGPAILRQKITRAFRRAGCAGTRHIIFCIADHFEPGWRGATRKRRLERVETWVRHYPRLAESHRDCEGRPVQHTWFCAADEYDPACLDNIAQLCRRGFGDIELHLHHENDTPGGFRDKLAEAISLFSAHGALVTNRGTGGYAFGFIHGNWALNNSRDGKWCGVDNELAILKSCGCYADFTLPSAPLESQTRKINSIYYAEDIPDRRKSHDTGKDVIAGGKEKGDLMLIQGPLALNWKRKKYLILPRIENGCIQGNDPGSPDRVDLWVDQSIHVRGRPDWIFIKVFCHGAQEADYDALLGGAADRMLEYLESEYNDGTRYRLHYVTAREMYNIIKAAEEVRSGDPGWHRDYRIGPYRYCS
ncbi:MAG: hypothetical protein WCY54_09350 [Syntrophales bacterium]